MKCISFILDILQDNNYIVDHQIKYIISVEPKKEASSSNYWNIWEVLRNTKIIYPKNNNILKVYDIKTHIKYHPKEKLYCQLPAAIDQNYYLSLLLPMENKLEFTLTHYQDDYRGKKIMKRHAINIGLQNWGTALYLCENIPNFIFDVPDNLIGEQLDLYLEALE